MSTGLFLGEYNVLNLRKKMFETYNRFNYEFFIKQRISKSKNSLQKVYLNIDDGALKKLNKTREQALKTRILMPGSSNYVSAKISKGGKELKCEVKLKGKLEDHFIHPFKWSFRVKLKDNKKLFSMKKFSLQHPKTRNYVNEWLVHQAAKKEGIISLKYEFVNLILNGENFGIYALEEGFSEELLERNSLKDGPLLKFSSSKLFTNNYPEHLNWHNFYNDRYLTSKVELYQESKIFKDSSFMKKFMKAKTMLQKFKSLELNTSKVFDIKKLSKLLAILNIFSAQHALGWNNCRFYFNPKTKLLDPIAYDLNASFNLTLMPNYPFSESLLFEETIFNDTVFVNSYMHNLNIMSKKEYLNSFFEKIKLELVRNIEILSLEFPEEDYATEKHFQKAEYIQKKINGPLENEIYANIDYISNSEILLTVLNTCNFPVKICSILSNSKEILKISKQNILYPRRLLSKIPLKKISLQINNEEHKKSIKNLELSYKIIGSETTNKIKIQPFPYEITETANFKKTSY